MRRRLEGTLGKSGIVARGPVNGLASAWAYSALGTARVDPGMERELPLRGLVGIAAAFR